MKTSLLTLVKKFPELIFRRLYLSTRGLRFEIECQLTADGKLATTDDESETFDSPTALARKFDSTITAASILNDIFLEPKRRRRLRNFLSNQTTASSSSATSTNEKAKRKCGGFKMWPSVNACVLQSKVYLLLFL